MISDYLVDIIILLIAAVVIVPFSQALRLGAVPGFLIAGIAVGNDGLGLITNFDEIHSLSELGVVLLLFVIGIELSPSRLWGMKRLVFGLGTLQVVVTGVIIGAILHIFLDVPLKTATLLGPALALSSTAFVLQLLKEQKLLHCNYGETTLSILLLQDLTVVPLLVLIPLLTIPEFGISADIALSIVESIVILVSVIFAGRYLLHPILYRIAISRNSEVFTASSILIVLGSAVLTEHAGLSMAMGAFLAGLLIADSGYRHQVISEIRPFRGLFMGLFFMSTGMLLDIDMIIAQPLLVIALLLLLITIKIVVLFPLTYYYCRDLGNSFAVATVLSQSGEFALVIFSLAFQSTLVSNEQFQQLLVVVILSMLVTPVLANIAKRAVDSERIDVDVNNMKPGSARIMIAGYGRIGHRIGEILTLVDQPFVALDSDPEVVNKERKQGYPVYFGDVRKPEILNSAGMSDVKYLIVTINDVFAAKEVVSMLHDLYPGVIVFARGHSLEQCQQLRSAGASRVVSENVEASLQLASMVLAASDLDENKTDAVIREFRDKYQSQIDNDIRLQDAADKSRE
jgi:monovalent cation:proton antiporter-2 (CPA2) family protein